MYRLVLYYLAALVGLAALASAFGLVPDDPAAIVFSSVVALVAAQGTNLAFSAVFRVPANAESAYITALIVALLMPPATTADPAALGAIAFASVWAISSKFILAVRGRHIFNPAALGVVLTGLLLDQPATWWVGGNLVLMPLVVIGGLLIARKLHRLDLIAVFVASNLAMVAATTPFQSVGTALSETLLHAPILFLAFAMLTEPLTAPQARWPRLAYAALVGVLAAPSLGIGTFYFTPELALLVGNLLAYATSPKGAFALTLLRIERVASGAYDYVFSADRPLRFAAGQYLEWTLPMRQHDSRGNRRYFTLASAPSDEDIRLGVKFHPHASAFKQALARMKPGDTIHAGQLAGEFVLPRDRATKLAFLAGGIGITPFRSMLEELRRTGERRDVVVLYGNASVADIAYADVLAAAGHALGVHSVYAVEAEAGDPAFHHGRIDAELIAAQVPDYAERLFYLSGPPAMVEALRKTLRRLGVPRRRIKVDYFPGLG